jgi:hypothetical protein
MAKNVLNVRPIPNPIQMPVNVFVRKDIIKHPLAHVIHVLTLGMPQQPRKPVINVLKTPVCGVSIMVIITVLTVIIPKDPMLGLQKQNVIVVRTDTLKTATVHCVQMEKRQQRTEQIVNKNCI